MKYFKEYEFSNFSKMNQHTLDCLDSFRESIGLPITITSDFAQSGHAPNSLHYTGEAIDGMINAPLWSFIAKAQQVGFTGIGLYIISISGVFVVKYFHLDTRKTEPQMWVGMVGSGGVTQYLYSLKK